MTIKKVFPTLYKLGKDKKLRVYSIGVTTDNCAKIKYGPIHGLKETVRPNSTVKYALSKHKRKISEGYSTKIPEDYPLSPMEYSNSGNSLSNHELTHGYYLQNPLDVSHRTLAYKNPHIKLISSLKTNYKSLNDIKNELTYILANKKIILDGFLYYFDNPELSVEYIICDCFSLENLGLTFKERLSILNTIKCYKHCSIIDTYFVKSSKTPLECYNTYFDKSSKALHHNLIIRDPKSTYRINGISPDTFIMCSLHG